ncbi:MAG: RloB family protein [Thermoplasmata archaeon]|nr:RloB family protein [Thermoplasmata archaeon]
MSYKAPWEKRSRKTDLDTVRKFILFVDGLTECDYFDRFIRPDSRISLKVYNSSKYLHNTRKMRAKLEKDIVGPKDVVAVVTDLDEHTREKITDLENGLRSFNAVLFMSNPSFEVWLVLHYGIPKGDLSQKGLEGMLSKHLGRPYVKADSIPSDADVGLAISNAEKLLPVPSTENCLDRIPSTMVHVLVKELVG